MVQLTQNVATEIQRLADIRLVTLYEIDATSLGGTIYRFSTSFDADIPVSNFSSVNNLLTITTVNNHALTTGDQIRIVDCNIFNFLGAFSVTVLSPTTFTVTLAASFSGSTTVGKVMRLDQKLRFNGNSYIPLPIEIQGIEWTSQNALPTPTVKISNIAKVLMPAIISLKDLIGAKFTRIRTFRKFLDDGNSPDPLATLPYDVFTINRKVNQNKYFLEFELKSRFDQEGEKLPRRQAIKNACLHRYRTWNPETLTFDYTNATCPYAGNVYFDENEVNVLNPAQDKCGKKLSSCKARFGNQPLPTRAFPGLNNSGQGG